MDYRSKIIPYLATGDSKTESLKTGNVVIKGSKQEFSLRSTSDRSSTISRIYDLTANDPLARMLFFLTPEFEFVPSRSFPLVVRYPIFLNKNERFFENGTIGKNSKYVRDMMESRDVAKEVAKESGTSALFRLIRMLFEDESFRRSVVTGKPIRGEEADNAFKELFERREKDAYEM